MFYLSHLLVDVGGGGGNPVYFSRRICENYMGHVLALTGCPDPGAGPLGHLRSCHRPTLCSLKIYRIADVSYFFKGRHMTRQAH